MMTVLIPAGSLRAESLIELDDAEVHHLKVRRALAGDTVRLLDGQGGLGSGELVLNGKRAQVRVDAASRVAVPPVLSLVVAAGDRERFSLVIEKAAELGATAGVPLECERTMGVATRVRAEHVERLARRAREAIKQSGSPWAPRVTQPRSLESVLADAPEGARWLADAEGGHAGRLNPGEPLTIVVGPEGGFTPGERAALMAARFAPVALGPHILRFETAAIAALAAAYQARRQSPEP